MRSARRTAHFILLAFLLSTACSPRLKSVDPSSVEPPIQFVREVAATREEIEKALGPPSATFEGGRVEIWNLDKGQRPIAAKVEDKPIKTLKAVKYNLVVVFNEQGVVERHALLRIR